jgi:hypothetical protein
LIRDPSASTMTHNTYVNKKMRVLEISNEAVGLNDRFGFGRGTKRSKRSFAQNDQVRKAYGIESEGSYEHKSEVCGARRSESGHLKGRNDFCFVFCSFFLHASFLCWRVDILALGLCTRREY